MSLFTIWFNRGWYITTYAAATCSFSPIQCTGLRERGELYILVQKQTVASEQCQFVGMCRPWQHLSFPTTAASSSTVLLVVIQSHEFTTVLNLWLELWNVDCMGAYSIYKTTHSTSRVQVIKFSKLYSCFSGEDLGMRLIMAWSSLYITLSWSRKLGCTNKSVNYSKHLVMPCLTTRKCFYAYFFTSSLFIYEASRIFFFFF